MVPVLSSHDYLRRTITMQSHYSNIDSYNTNGLSVWLFKIGNHACRGVRRTILDVFFKMEFGMTIF